MQEAKVHRPRTHAKPNRGIEPLLTARRHLGRGEGIVPELEQEVTRTCHVPSREVSWEVHTTSSGGRRGGSRQGVWTEGGEGSAHVRLRGLRHHARPRRGRRQFQYS